MARSGNADGAGPQTDHGNAPLVAGPARPHPDLASSQARPPAGAAKQPGAISQAAVLRRSHHQLDRRRPTREQGKNVAFTVADNDQLAGSGRPLGHRLCGAQPALRFLLLQTALAPRRDPLADRAGPDRRVEQPDHRLVLGIDGHRSVDEKTRRLAVAGRTQAAARPIAPAEIDLRGILNRDNPPPAAALTGAPPPAAALTGAPPQRPDNLCRAHPRRIEK